MRTGIAHLPLHGGKAPRWLFDRMTKLAREILIVMASEHDSSFILKRLSDPYWFQAFGCLLGFDWHSSGLTTTVCGALKEGAKGLEKELDFYVAGGKGKTSRKTPSEIQIACEKTNQEANPLIYASRLSAKVDNSAVQDGYELYHHCFFFNSKNDWAVVQQGMNNTNHYARRYHWLNRQDLNFVCEPHAAVCANEKAPTLNMVATESHLSRE